MVGGAAERRARACERTTTKFQLLGTWGRVDLVRPPVGQLRSRGLKSPHGPPGRTMSLCLVQTLVVVVVSVTVRSRRNQKSKTLSGGSLGSCVDEERSQLRELM